MIYTLDEIRQRIRPVAEKYRLRAVYVPVFKAFCPEYRQDE